MASFDTASGWVLRLPRASVEVTCALRLCAGVEVAETPEALWLRGPEADAALFASHFSPPSLPCHGATRTVTVQAICVCVPALVMSTFFTVDATMNAREREEDSSACVGSVPPGHDVA